jgi:malonate decarboxylase beta subunit
MQAEQARLETRLEKDGNARDATEIWARRGLKEADGVADLTEDDFIALCAREAHDHDAR